MSKTRHLTKSSLKLGSMLRLLTDSSPTLTMALLSSRCHNQINKVGDNESVCSNDSYSSTNTQDSLHYDTECETPVLDLSEEKECLSPKSVLNDLRTICQLDEGAQGVVYKVQDKLTKTLYAMKV